MLELFLFTLVKLLIPFGFKLRLQKLLQSYCRTTSCTGASNATQEVNVELVDVKELNQLILAEGFNVRHDVPPHDSEEGFVVKLSMTAGNGMNEVDRASHSQIGEILICELFPVCKVVHYDLIKLWRLDLNDVQILSDASQLPKSYSPLTEVFDQLLDQELPDFLVLDLSSR